MKMKTNYIRFFLFRDFHVEVDGQAVDGFMAQKARELLCFLLLHRERPFLREVLTTYLWEESDADRAKKYFRQTLWQLQNDLRNLTGDSGKYWLSLDADWVQINTHLHVWSDVDVFEQAFRDTQGIPGSALIKDQVQSLQTAVNLYCGDLLEGWYQDWCLFERERLQNIYLMILDKLMTNCEANGLFEDGIVYGMGILKIDYAREKTHRGLMRIFYQMGDRTNALRQYERCVAILNAEMGVTPSLRTQKLFESIRKDQLIPAVGSVNPHTHPAQRISLDRLVFHLSQLRQHLVEANQEVEQDIEIVQNILLENK